MAAMDTTLPNNNQISRKYNITGFPTLIYFENGVMQYGYPGENNRASLVNFLKNPKPEAEEKPKETEWKDEPSEVHHLTGKKMSKLVISKIFYLGGTFSKHKVLHKLALII